MNSGTLEGLSPEEQQIAQKFKQYFDNAREFSNGLVKTRDPGISPLNIPKLENYVPHIAQSVSEMIPTVESKVQQTLDKLSESLGRPITSLDQLSSQEQICDRR
jgi:hypothetical protein